MASKIAFLFLTIANITHEPIWQRFFENSADKSSIYIHSKEEFNPHSSFKQYEMPEKIPSTWANTMEMQVAMLKKALENPENQKFIFVSGDSVPLQTFPYIYQEVMKHDFSIFEHWWNHHQDPVSSFYYEGRILKDIPQEHQRINPQWVILNRKHAQLMIEDKTILPLIIQTTSDQEHYPSTFLSLKGCLSEIIQQPIMLVVWNRGYKHPYTFDNMEDRYQRELVVEAISCGKLFGRKFDQSCKSESIQAIISQYACKTDKELGL